MKDALSEARNKIASATSLGTPSRPHRVRGFDRFQIFRPSRLLWQALYPLGVDRSWRHRIDPDATCGPFEAKCLVNPVATNLAGP